MYTFSQLLKRIRKEAGLTQEELATILDVSTVLISMLETERKEASKKFIGALAEKLQVHPSSIIPFIFISKDRDFGTSILERRLITVGEALQNQLIRVKAKNLRSHASDR